MILNLTSLKSYLIGTVIILFILQNLHAQNNIEMVPRVSFWEFGFSAGVSKFSCSRNPNANAVYKSFNYWNSPLNAGFTLSAQKHISPVFSIELEYLKTSLSGSWDASKGYPVPPDVIAEGLTYPPPFKTGINQLCLLLNSNLNKLFAPKLASDNWYLFFNAGAGFIFLKKIKGFEELSGKKNRTAILFGPGLSVKINAKIKALVGFTRYIADTDRLDALHTQTSEPDGSYTSVMNVNERYFYTYIGISYRFEKKEKKPEETVEPYYKPTVNRSTIWDKFRKHYY
jgi:hypothetical protein